MRSSSLHDVDYRTKTISCSRCSAAAYLCLVEPIKETGMGDYRLDERSEPERHPVAAKRLVLAICARSVVSLSIISSPTATAAA